MTDSLEAHITESRRHFDLTEPSHQAGVVELAEKFLNSSVPLGELLERTQQPDTPLEARIAALLADSRR